ncbi:hypothetical protein F5Y18DRAFT_432352 [Xylariaceae sp. FL1019]|nr:hypothetical protein F5Y18DRAFT_432352 [Xylariaceae sp. FL1019]
MAEPQFQLFEKLPTEIRVSVWAYYSLSKTPMVHAMSFDAAADSFYIKHRKVIINSFPVDETTTRPDFEMVRALMQTNREARYEALQGRELQGPQKRTTPDTCTDVYYGGAWHEHQSVETPKYHYFFVNWDTDLFYFRCGLHIAMGLILHDSCVQKMQRIAIDIRGPFWPVDGDLMVPRWAKFSGVKYAASPLPMTENRDYHSDNLISLEHLTLVLPYRVLYDAEITISEPSTLESSIADETDPGEAQGTGPEDIAQGIAINEAINFLEGVGDDVGFDEDDYHCDDECSFNGLYFPNYMDRTTGRWKERETNDTPKVDKEQDGFGFHLIERSTELLYGRKEAQYIPRETIDEPVATTLDRWVQGTKSAAARDMHRILGRNVGVNMVMDDSGDYRRNVVGYDRVWGNRYWLT